MELDQLDAEVDSPEEEEQEEFVPETPGPVVIRQCMVVSTDSALCVPDVGCP